MFNLKKVISSVAALAIVASSASAFAVTFPDVDESASYATAVTTLTALNVINGDDNGLFNPDNNVTRAEFTKMAVEALGNGAAATSQTTSKFNDAANTSVHWAAGYVAQGVADGFIDGYDDVTFGPDDQVTYAQACKMLVAAIGYTTYAEAAGGWPTGYVSQASTLGITKGVSADNDKQLTRAECAVMIYNAMQAPLCMVDGYETVSTATGYVQAPTIKVYDDEDKDYQTLLTYKHDAYVVKGRVMATSKSDNSLDADEVKYDVEVADNFDDKTYPTSSDAIKSGVEMYVGDTKAADMLFSYTQAIVQKDDDEDSWTILSIEEYGKSKTVEFDADDVDLDDDKDAAIVAGSKIEVFKSESTTSTTKYNLEEDVALYVNGQETDLTAENVAKYLGDANKVGKVTLVDKTDVGSTSTNGDYDYIMVTYYIDAVVSSVQTSSTEAKVYLYGNSTGETITSMKWDPDDEDLDIEFLKDGEKIEYTDLAEYDVLSIQANPDINIADIGNDDFATILVSSQTVTGKVSSVDDDDLAVTVDGTDYDIASAKLVDLGEFTLNDEYTLYIDAFGYVAYQEEGATSKNYGLLVGMYTSSDGDDYMVRLITADGKIVSYATKETNNGKDVANAAYKILTGNATYPVNTTVNKNTANADIEAGETAVTYKLSGGKIKDIVNVDVVAVDTKEYKTSTSKIGSYTINDSVSQIINIEDYMSDDSVSAMTVSDFVNENEYTGFVFDKASSGAYKFVVITEGLNSLTAKTELAVVQKTNGTTQAADDTDCTKVVVSKGGNADVEVLFEGTSVDVAEGDVIQYVVSSDGYVKDGYTVLFAGSQFGSYTDLLDAVLDKTTFADVEYAVTANNTTTYYPAFDASMFTGDNELHLGVVYKHTSGNLEVFPGQTSGTSYLSAIEDYTVSNANSYVYNFANKAKYRAEVGSYTQASTIFKQVSDDDDNVIWADVTAEKISPAIAIVKIIDNDETDVVYYTGEYGKN